MSGSSSKSRTTQTNEEMLTNLSTQDIGDEGINTQVGLNVEENSNVQFSMSDYGALDTASEIAVGAYDLVKTTVEESTERMETALQTAQGAIDKSIALSELAAKSETQNLFGDYMKYGALIIAIMAGAYVLVKRKK